MARAKQRLTAIAVRNLATPGMHADGDGLYLRVNEAGVKTWILRYRFGARRRDMGLGAAGDRYVTLAEARDGVADARRLLRANIDPIESRRRARMAALAEVSKAVSFKDAADAYIRANEAGWKNAKHAAQWTSTLSTYVYPVIGALPIQSVDTNLVLKVLEPIWRTKSETANRVRGRVEAILDAATARKLRQGENPARWKGHLDKLLPKRSKVARVKHHAALPYDEIGDFMTALRGQSGHGARALELAILTAARTGEVIGARWDEIDLEKALWIVPADRMKAGKEHRIPLSDTAVALLEEMKTLREGPHVFAGAKNGQPLSNMAMLMVLRRMQRSDLTAHGFRSTFRDWAAERTAYPAEVAEMALAHAVGDKVEAAYRRGDLFEKRARLMQDWADFCSVTSGSAAGNVVPLRQA